MSHPLFPDLSPKFAELLRLVNDDQPVDEDEELTKLENEHAAWKEEIARHNSNMVPIGVAVEPEKPRPEDTEEEDVPHPIFDLLDDFSSYFDDDEEEVEEEIDLEDLVRREQPSVGAAVPSVRVQHSVGADNAGASELLHQSDEEATTKPIRI